MPAKSKVIQFKLDHIISDRTQYKPYIAHLQGENIYVNVEVPAGDVVEDGKKMILTVDGMAAVLESVANAIETMNENYRLKKYGV